MTTETTITEIQTVADFEREQREWLIENSKRIVTDLRDRLDHVAERYPSWSRRAAMTRYYNRGIEQELAFLRREGIDF